MDILLAFTLTMLAGLSTGIGSLIAFFAKRTNTKFLSVSLGFSAGVMIFVSMREIFDKALDYITKAKGENLAGWITAAAFFCGMLFIGLIDKILPENKNPHESKLIEEEQKEIDKSKTLMRMGVFTALAIAVHNFPEGLATFVSALSEPSVAIPIFVAIALHNIPEGIAVSVPIYQATGSKKKAFLYSFLSGLSEPIGALVGYLVLMPFLNDLIFGIIFAFVAGIMVYISVDELLPSAREYGHHHLSIYGLVGGMVVMCVSLLIF